MTELVDQSAFWDSESEGHWSEEDGPVQEYVVQRIKGFLERSARSVKNITGQEINLKEAFFVDVASGSFNNQYYPHDRVPDIAIDSSPKMLARNKSKNKKLANITDPLPLEDGISDVTTSFMSMRYLSDEEQERLLKEMLRITRPGGMVFISDFPMKILPKEKSHAEVNIFDVYRINAAAKKIPDAHIPQDIWNSHIDNPPAKEDMFEERYADSIFFLKKWD